MNTRTYTLPADNNTDTKVTNTLGRTTKAYITGTTTATTNTGTQVFDDGIYLDTTAGRLTADTFNGALASTTLGSDGSAVDYNNYFSQKGLQFYAVSSNAVSSNSPTGEASAKGGILTLPISASTSTQFVLDGNNNIHIRSRTTSSSGNQHTAWKTFVNSTYGTAVGSLTKPVYVSTTGVATACSTYAGGTAVTLNGSSKGASTASFYAPTSVGTSGYVLTSNGIGAPTWSAPSSLTAGELVWNTY